MRLKIAVNGAKQHEIARGLAAAQAVFDQAGVAPLRAAEARFAVEGWDDRGFVDPIDDADLDICDLWNQADEAALKTCCEGWDEARTPETAYLELVDDTREETTFTLFDMEDDDDEFTEQGLSLDQAVQRLMERAGHEFEIRRIDGVMRLFLIDQKPAPPDAPKVDTSEVRSTAPDDGMARREIYLQIVYGKPLIGGSWVVVTDDDFQEEQSGREGEG